MMARRSLHEEAADWVVRLNADQRTRADEAAFRAWLDADPEHARVYAEHAAVWSGVEALAENDDAREILMPERPRRSSARVWSRRAAVAGGLGVAAAAAAVAPMLWQGEAGADRFATSRGEQKRLRLADGSRVVLNTDSVLRVSLGGAERRLYLDRGQAFFQVAKDPKRPFRVFAGADEVRAVGTAFEVRRLGDRARVTLEEGIVAIYRHASSPSLLVKTAVAPPLATLAPGQQLDLTGAGAITAPREVDLRKSQAWRYGRLILDDAPLGETVADLNRYGGRQIVLADPSLADIRVSGVFHTGRPDAFVEVMTAAFPIRVAREDSDTIVLAPR